MLIAMRPPNAPDAAVAETNIAILTPNLVWSPDYPELTVLVQTKYRYRVAPSAKKSI
jgi:hypothetical protein